MVKTVLNKLVSFKDYTDSTIEVSLIIIAYSKPESYWIELICTH